MDRKGVDSNRVREKVQQVQGYIQRTVTAIAALEKQGNLATQSDTYIRFVTLKKSLQQQEKEYLDILACSEKLERQKEARKEEDRRLQETVKSNEPEYEDPLARAETWSSEDIETSIVESQAILEKMNRIQDLYAGKAQTIDPNDEETQARLDSRMDQVAEKRRQLSQTIMKLCQIKRQRQESTEPEAPTMTETPTVPEDSRVVVSGLAMVNDSISALGVEPPASINEEENPELASVRESVSLLSEEVASK